MGRSGHYCNSTATAAMVPMSSSSGSREAHPVLCTVAVAAAEGHLVLCPQQASVASSRTVAVEPRYGMRLRLDARLSTFFAVLRPAPLCPSFLPCGAAPDCCLRQATGATRCGTVRRCCSWMPATSRPSSGVHGQHSNWESGVCAGSWCSRGSRGRQTHKSCCRYSRCVGLVCLITCA